MLFRLPLSAKGRLLSLNALSRSSAANSAYWGDDQEVDSFRRPYFKEHLEQSSCDGSPKGGVPPLSPDDLEVESFVAVILPIPRMHATRREGVWHAMFLLRHNCHVREGEEVVGPQDGATLGP